MWNQNDVKENLDKVYHCVNEYTCIFTGKKSKNVNGKYLPATKEILLNNRNFNDDNNLLFFTALHELAHHVVYAENNRKEGHTSFFWSTFYDLITKAEKLGFYTVVISDNLKAKIDKVKELDVQISKLTSEMGTALIEVQTICKEENVRYEDITDRTIGIKRTTVKKTVKIATRGIPNDISSDAKTFVALTSDLDKAQKALILLQQGKTIDQVKQIIKEPMEELEEIEELEEKKNKLIHKIEVLTIQVQQLDEKINGGK